MFDSHKSSASIEASRWINVIVAFGAIIMFVVICFQIIPASVVLPGSQATAQTDLIPAFLLTIALIIFAWRRSVDLKKSTDASLEAEKRTYQLAYKDDTTGLFNRRFMIDCLESADAVDGNDLTLLLIDVDHFKKVNDLYGHSAGDALLQTVAERIQSIAPSGACSARLGGDEFAIFLRGKDADHTRATLLAERLLEEISKPIQLEATRALVSASIGLSTSQAIAQASSSLMKQSDIAMYDAKARGRNRYSWFDHEMERELNERTLLETEMRDSLAQDNFVPYFQVLRDLESGEVHGFEVLARWQHPTKGVIEPDDFIAIAETTGMISEMSSRVMRKAFIIAKEWPDHLTLSVNISPVQFKDPALAQHMLKLLTETGYNPNRLEIEITESTLIDNPELTALTVQSLKNFGIKISLDDFGTGYASLSQLRQLPFDRIKIDRSFVAALFDDEQSNAIVHAVATLGKSLNLPITAEGVETEKVHQRVKSLGCTDAQGWLFGKAMSAEETAKLFLQMEEPTRMPIAKDALDPSFIPKDQLNRARRGR